LIYYVKNMTNERIPPLGENGEPTEPPPCWDGQFTYEFEPGETKPMPEKAGRIISNIYYPRLQVVHKAGEGEAIKADFTIGSEGALETFGAANDRPGKKKAAPKE